MAVCRVAAAVSAGSTMTAPSPACARIRLSDDAIACAGKVSQDVVARAGHVPAAISANAREMSGHPISKSLVIQIWPALRVTPAAYRGAA